MKSVVTSVRLERDENVSDIRRQARVAAGSAGAAIRDQIRFATATSEIARNALEYAGGGHVELDFEEVGGRKYLLARVQDSGPGIANVEALLATRSDNPQNGLALGLRGAQRLVDHFDLDTGENGTLITLGLCVTSALPPTELAAEVAKALVIDAGTSPVEELAHQNRALRDALAEQQVLLREIHHRTKNNLAVIQSLASLQARLSKGPETREALTVLTGRIQAYANAHNHLQFFDGMTRVDLIQHLETLVQRIAGGTVCPETTVAVEVEPLSVSFESASELALIVNELMAMAQARGMGRPSHIALEAGADSEALHLVLRAETDGFGRPEAATTAENLLSWRIIEGCVRKLDGRLSIEGEAGEVIAILCPGEARRRPQGSQSRE